MEYSVNTHGEATFEERLEQLEALADKIEAGSLPLQELMAAYEDGVKLSAGLRLELELAKARIMEIKLGRDAVPEPSDLTEPCEPDAPEDEE